jgi:hypothetical protein
MGLKQPRSVLLASSIAALIIAAGNPAFAQEAPLLPPNAKAGECYARVLLPAEYSTDTQQVVLREASTKVEVIPAQYETGTEQVLVREASKKLEVIPAVYEDGLEQVLVRPAATRLVEVPATYRTVTEQVLESPAQTIWKKGGIASQSGRVLKTAASGETGEVLCLVEVPAKYKTVTRSVLDQPATTQEIAIPAEYTTVKTRILKSPPTTREIEIPAEYKTVTVTKLVKPATTRTIEIPAEYQTVSTQKLLQEPTLEWRRVLCDENLTHSNIVAMQKALADKGIYSGPVDGIIGAATISAVNQFAKSRNLPTGSNFITIDVAKDLGVSL